MDVMEINAITGEVTARDFTAAEQSQREVDRAAAEQSAAEQSAAEKARLKIVSDARAFALSLGFTEAMLAVMYPQLEGA